MYRAIMRQPKTIPIYEDYPEDYSGLPFLTLVQTTQNTQICLIDNLINKTLKVFVMDLCVPAEVDEEMLITKARDWYENDRASGPISVYFSQHGMSAHTTKIFRSFNIESVVRVIGPVFVYPIFATVKVKKRRKKSISPNIAVHVNTVIEQVDILQ